MTRTFPKGNPEHPTCSQPDGQSGIKALRKEELNIKFPVLSFQTVSCDCDYRVSVEIAADWGAIVP